MQNLNKKLLFKKFFNNFELNILNLKINPFIFLFKTFTIGRIISQTYGKLKDYHLEMIRKTVKNYLSKKSLVFLRIKPYLVMLKRATQVRMGGGKASNIDFVYYPVYPGCIIFDIYGITYSNGFNSFKSLLSKLPIKIKLIFLNII